MLGCEIDVLTVGALGTGVFRAVVLRTGVLRGGALWSDVPGAVVGRVVVGCRTAGVSVFGVAPGGGRLRGGCVRVGGRGGVIVVVLGVGAVVFDVAAAESLQGGQDDVVQGIDAGLVQRPSARTGEPVKFPVCGRFFRLVDGGQLVGFIRLG